MHDEIDFPGQLGDLGDDEIEIEFVDGEDDQTVTEPDHLQQFDRAFRIGF